MKNTHAFLKLTAMAVGLALMGAVAAQPPKPAPPKPFSVPQTTEFRLDNGLGATLIPYGALPKVSVQVAVRTGNLNEGEKRWLANLTASLLEEGTTQRSGQQVAADVAAMGGEIYVQAGQDETLIGGDALAEFAPELVTLLAEIVRSPALPESELERVRADLLRQLDVARSRAQNQAQEAFLEAVYGGHPYGDIYPDAEQFGNLSVADARAFHESEFGARRSHVYVAGQFDARAVRGAIEDAFSDWKSGPEVLLDPPEPHAERGIVLAERQGAPQSSLVFGLPVVDPGHPDYLQLQVMNTLLGGSFGSRITSNIREDKGYTYSPFSLLRENHRTVAWAQHADVTTEHTADSLREIIKEINRLQDEPPSPEELEGIKNYLSGTFVLGNSNRGSIIRQLRRIRLHGLPDDYLSTYIQRINAVTPEQVSAMAHKYLDIDRMTLVVVGDLEQVKPQLQELDWVREGELE